MVIKLLAFFAPLYLNTGALHSAVGDESSLGCWSEGPGGSPHILHHIVGGSWNLTVDGCISTCTERGFALAGVEHGTECYCGNAILYNYHYSTACTTPCAGNVTQTCGGSGAVEIFPTGIRPYTIGPARILQSYGNWTYGCCLLDIPVNGKRVLSERPSTPILSEEMTPQRCLDACGASGYNAAGPEAGQECWCGNIIKWPPGQSTLDTECDAPCLDDATHYCGGSQRIMVYVTQILW